MARPTSYNLELAALICERLGQGEALKRICQDDHMPSQAIVYIWLTKHPEFLEMYTRAREDQADTLADEITDIADRADPENVNVARLRVDARKWVAAKLKPKKYGDKTETEHTGKVALECSWQSEPPKS
jgi:hypothetical protein